jgi:hypothetical protein
MVTPKNIEKYIPTGNVILYCSNFWVLLHIHLCTIVIVSMISNYIQEYFLYPRKPTKHQGIKKIEKFTSAVGPLESQAWAGFRGAQIGPKGT